MTDDTTPTKICTKCGKEYPATPEFWSRDMMGSLGLKSQCKLCRSEQERDWRKANPEKERVRHRRWRKANPEKMRAMFRRWRKANSEKMREAIRLWRKAHPERVRERVRRWKRANHEKVRASNHRRRARERQANGSFSDNDIRQMFAAQQGQCYYCACDIGAGYHVEHKIPLSRGGTNYPDNLALACPACNLKKGAQTAEEFLESMGGAYPRPLCPSNSPASNGE